jgi:methylthioxylose transferase
VVQPIDTAERPQAEESAEHQRRGGYRADLVAAVLAVALVAAANVVIIVLHWYTLYRIFAWAPPLFGHFLPHVGPGTPVVLVLAVAVIARGPELAARLSWGRLSLLGYAAAVVWTFGLAMISGWPRFPDQFTSGDQYLRDVPKIADIGTMLHEFTSRILAGQPDSWITQVSGHPPGAFLVFIWLDRIGLGGGAWAGITCLLVGCLAAVAVPATVRALGDESSARTLWPFTVLFPGAICLGISADGLFTGVTAVGVLALAVGAARLRDGRGPVLGGLACVGGGVLLGYGIYLSYGLVLIAPIALAVCLLRRAWWAVLLALVGAALVVAAFTWSGFWWLDGYHLVIQRYYQDLGRTRPYDYWLWANLAALVLASGPALAPGLRRAVLDPIRTRRLRPVAVLVLAAALAVAVADKSGFSKAEVERIWLPFGVWLTSGAALLPPASRRWWLAAQAVTALAVGHLVMTSW